MTSAVAHLVQTRTQAQSISDADADAAVGRQQSRQAGGQRPRHFGDTAAARQDNEFIRSGRIKCHTAASRWRRRRDVVVVHDGEK